MWTTIDDNTSLFGTVFWQGIPMELRELKALEIAAREKIVFDGVNWLVPSQSGNGKYRVAIGADSSCTCEDFQLRREPCKHVLAARLVCARDHGGKAPEIVVDAVPKKPQYPQPWAAYTRAQMTEKARVQVLLADLVRNVPELPWTGGRSRIPIADALFGMVFKVYSTLSARRFGTDMREAHENGFTSRPVHPMKICSYMDTAEMTPILEELVGRSALPLRLVETTFAVDSTGFSSSKFKRWYDAKYGCERSQHAWAKLHAIVGCKTNVIVGAKVLGEDSGDSPQFRPLVENAAASGFQLKEVTGDKAYLSHDALALVDSLGGVPFIPFKINSTAGEPGSLWSKMYGYFTYRRDEFLKRYHARSNVEASFSAVKRLMGDHVRSRTDVSMVNEVLCKLIAFNLTVIVHEQEELGIEAEFWRDEPADVSPAVLKFPALA